MLTCLRVRHFAVVDQLEIELADGLHVFTGETGAGKSVLVHALQLVLGARGRPEVVRSGCPSAEVEALFDLSRDPAARARLAEAGFDVDDEVVVRRVVYAGGRTRAYVNGRLAPASQLAALAAGWVDISSQHAHHSLLDPAQHLEHLDAFGGLEDLRDRVAEAHRRLAAATAALASAQVRDRAEREGFLRFQLQEIETLDPAPGEDERLAAELSRLRHASRLAAATGGTEARLYADDDALCGVLARLGQTLAEAAELDPSLADTVTQLDGARATLEEVARDLGAYARGVTLDPARLAEVEERADGLRRLARKHGGTLEGVLAHRDQLARELEDLDAHEARTAELEAARDAAVQDASEAARALREARLARAEDLGARIGAELAALGMAEARVHVDVTPLEARGDGLIVDGARLTPTGADRVELLIAPNRGEEARPLRRIASGGELSRTLLAIKRVLADVGTAGVYVFDEVDAGVGGAVAEVIGRKLHDVAARHQVLCITHLPQIAAYADRHFRVEKEVVRGRTRSAVERLTDDARLTELARMLGGLRVTERTRAVAAELLRDAREPTAPRGRRPRRARASAHA